MIKYEIWSDVSESDVLGKFLVEEPLRQIQEQLLDEVDPHWGEIGAGNPASGEVIKRVGKQIDKIRKVELERVLKLGSNGWKIGHEATYNFLENSFNIENFQLSLHFAFFLQTIFLIILKFFQ